MRIMSYEASKTIPQRGCPAGAAEPQMKLASLHSGGKDSTYSVLLAEDLGHEIRCLLTVFPKSDQSHLLHHPNLRWTGLQARSMGVPHLAVSAGSDDAGDEAAALEAALLRARRDFGIDGLVHGGIRSEFQKARFGRACERCGLEPLAPLWGRDPVRHMHDLLEGGFRYVVTSVSSGGLDDYWLGRQITAGDIKVLAGLAARHGFSPDFEGGEAETFVTDCPLFSRPIEILRGDREWDGYRGRFEIVDAELTSDARQPEGQPPSRDKKGRKILRRGRGSHSGAGA